eukprot:TRINITY_DN62078_c0_g1_i2.p1 TRINITY_DN62078_c0_g1~~TRINITY_DN62078_c0_g1_i2.p1  ORF type:complete len:537 (-),score=53.36 TRINITY_DN62078_c0_g1_i2:5-1615(-)
MPRPPVLAPAAAPPAATALHNQSHGSWQAAASGHSLCESLHRQRTVLGRGSVSFTIEASETSGVSSKRSSKRTLVALPSMLDAELLRATTLCTVLSGNGKHLASNIALKRDYHLSTSVSQIDDFLSHDWGTPRFAKLAALLFLYNHRVASVASLVAGVLAGFVGACYGVPFAARLLCPAVWLFVFVFGQRLKLAISCRSRRVFLDKLCIDQTDPRKKKASILGLAGFLRTSKRLVVLWSPRYFTRLWCAYELAAWCYLHSAHSGRIAFTPVTRARILIPVTIGLAAHFAIRVMTLQPDAVEDWIRYYLTNLFLVIASVVLLLASTVSLVHELEQMEELVQRYNMRDADCYCCTHKHVHPETGAKMPCDRRLVYKTLLMWWTKAFHEHDDDCEKHDPGEQSEEHAVDAFNEEVRSKLLQVVRQTTDSSFVFCSYQDVVFAAVPVMWAGCDQVIVMVADGFYAMGIRWLLEFTSVWLFVMPLTLVITVRFMSWSGKRVRGTKHPRCVHCLWLASISFIFFIVRHGTRLACGSLGLLVV